MNLAKKSKPALRGTDTRRSELNSAILELKKLRRDPKMADSTLSVFVSKYSVIVQKKEARQLPGREVVSTKLKAQVAPPLFARSTAMRGDSYTADRERDVAYFERMSKLVQSAKHDNERAVGTLKSSPSNEALAFYGTLSKK
jgi:hypothetical protein